MSSVLVCHIPEDAEGANALGAAIERRGLRVRYFADPTKAAHWLSDLFIHDAVIVVWSAASLRAAGLHDIAREALYVRRLISVRVDGTAIEHVPSEFRKNGAPQLGDLDNILHLINQVRPPAPPPPRRVGAAPETSDIGAAAPRPRPRGFEGVGSGYGFPRRDDIEVGAAEPPRFSVKRGVEGIGAADTAPVRSVAPSAPQNEALALQAGRLVHKIPQKMWVGEKETVEVRLGRAEAEKLTHGLVGRGALSSHDVPILETMSVSLYARGGAFEIERQSETTQLVAGEQLKGTPFEQADYGRWIWLVTPRKSGAHLLFVKVSASLKDSRGLPTSASLPDREFPVSVSVNAGKTTVLLLRRGLIGIGGAVGAGLLGSITQELWWPRLKELLHAWGWLG